MTQMPGAPTWSNTTISRTTNTWVLLNIIALLKGNPYAGPITNIPAARRWLVEELIAAGINNGTADERLNGVLDEARLNNAAFSRVHGAHSSPHSVPAV